MADVMAKDTAGVLLFECPGCGFMHAVYPHGCLSDYNPSQRWQWNGLLDRPTLQPSLMVTWEQQGKPMVCHSFVVDGKIQFLGDCTHDKANQTVDIPAWEN